MSPIAASGARSAPAVSSAWRSPNARPRISRRGFVGDHGIARRAANALADAIREPCEHQQGSARRQREQGLRQCCEPIAANDPRLAPQASVRNTAGEQFREIRRGFRGTVDRAERRYGKSKNHRNEGRQERVIDLAREVHEQADEAEDPDIAGKGRTSGHRMSSSEATRRGNWINSSRMRLAMTHMPRCNIAPEETFVTLQSCWEGARHRKRLRRGSRGSRNYGLSKRLENAPNAAGANCYQPLQRTNRRRSMMSRKPSIAALLR